MNQNSQNREQFNEESSKPIKKKTNSIFKLVLILLILGGGLATVGLGMGANISETRAPKLLGITVHSNTGRDTATLEVSKDFATSNGEIKYLENLNLESFDKIKSDSIYMDVKIIQADNYGIKISYNQKQGEYTYKVENDTLKIRNENKTTININSKNFVDDYITIYVPENIAFKEIDIDNISGNIFLENIISDKLRTNSTSADINLYNIKSDELNISSVSGNIFTDEINSEIINCKTTSGIIEFGDTTNFSKSKDKSKFDINSVSGDISIVNSDLQNVDLKTTSGKIKIDSSKIEKLTANSVSGSIEADEEFLDAISLKSTSGKIILNTLIEKSEYNYDISSTSGSINIDGTKYKKNVTQNNGKDSSNKIKITTTSGNIELDF